MKRTITLIVFLLFWILLQSEPVIQFERLFHQFGEIKEEAGPHRVDFKFSNTGDEPFRVIKVIPG